MADEQEVVDEPQIDDVVEEHPVEAVEDEGPLVVQIGDEEPDGEVSEDEVAKAPAWVQELRKRDREREKEKRELVRRVKELEAATTPAPDAPKLGAKPTLEGCDYDEGAFESALEAWYQDKAKVEASQREAEERQRAEQEAWQAKVASYQEAKAKLPFPDYDDAESIVQDTFDVTQQGLIIKHALDAPKLVYALGKNPKKAAELAAIKTYDDFVAAAVRLEAIMKETRKPAVSPERSVSVPSGTGVVSTDNTLERLREEAAKTGDFSKVLAYKRSRAA